MGYMKARITELIDKLGIAQKTFGESIDIKPAYINDIIKGRAKGFSSESLVKIQTVYGVNLNWLLTGEGEMFLPGKELKKEAPPESAKSIKDVESRYGHVEKSECEKRKNHRGFEVIDGNVQEYLEIDIIEKIARTKWWYGLTETEREIIVFTVHLRNDEMKEKVRNALSSGLDTQEAEEKLNREMKELAEAMKGKLPRRQKGDAG